MPMRLVLDTSVMVAAFRSTRGASYELLRRAADHRFAMVVTPALFLEYETVLLRPEQRAVHGLSIGETHQLLDVLSELIVPVQVYFQWRPSLEDADDELVLEAAVNGRADAIVTHNIRDFRAVQRRFGVRVIRPSEANKEVSD